MHVLETLLGQPPSHGPYMCWSLIASLVVCAISCLVVLIVLGTSILCFGSPPFTGWHSIFFGHLSPTFLFFGFVGSRLTLICLS